MAYKKKEVVTGRRGGNLKSVDGGFMNNQGVFFTLEEKKALESAVNTANRKRARMLDTEGKLPRKYGGKELGETIGESVRTMNHTSDFILAPKSKSLHQFTSKKGYYVYLNNLRRVNDRNYIDVRVMQYKTNFCAGLRNAFGEDAEPIVETIMGMSNAEYMEKVEGDETLEFGYLYGPDPYYVKLNHIRGAVGLPPIEH